MLRAIPLRFVCRFAFVIGAGLGMCMPAGASHMVTGNGFGFAVVAPETGTTTKFYSHPYSNVRPDPANSLSEGVETANYIKQLGWGDGTAHGAAAEYEEDSHVIHVRRSDGEGFVFMPFGFAHPALVISWETARASGDGWKVDWNKPVKSQRVVRVFGLEF